MFVSETTHAILDKLYKDHQALMESIEKILMDDTQTDLHKKYYNKVTHWHLMRNAWEILLPVSQEEWFTDLKKLGRYNKQMPWPQYNTYQYCMDVVAPPNVPFMSLYFGYAVLKDGTVVKTCFSTGTRWWDIKKCPRVSLWILWQKFMRFLSSIMWAYRLNKKTWRHLF